MQLLPANVRRLYAATEAKRLGKRGLTLVSEITGMSAVTIRRGQEELDSLMAGNPVEKKVGRPGRRPTTVKYPGIEHVIERMIADETGGDPMTQQCYVRMSSRNLSRRLSAAGYQMSNHTAWKLLKQMGYSMKVNEKIRALTRHAPKRDAQFAYIKAQKLAFQERGDPVISVDSKKKELIGDFRADGKLWCKQPVQVNEYKFASMAECVAAPYGIYDVGANKGYVWVGTSADTPAFAVRAIKEWWMVAGRHLYPSAKNLLVLADGGGSNGYRSRAWKYRLQIELCDAFALTVTVAHFPTGCSKYNPVERRLFSHISMNWAGRPLSSLEIMLALIRGTSTQSGLTVDAFLLEGTFCGRETIPEAEMARLSIEGLATCPEWNYKIYPHAMREDATE